MQIRYHVIHYHKNFKKQFLCSNVATEDCFVQLAKANTWHRAQTEACAIFCWCWKSNVRLEFIYSLNHGLFVRAKLYIFGTALQKHCCMLATATSIKIFVISMLDAWQRMLQYVGHYDYPKQTLGAQSVSSNYSHADKSLWTFF